MFITFDETYETQLVDLHRNYIHLLHPILPHFEKRNYLNVRTVFKFEWVNYSMQIFAKMGQTSMYFNTMVKKLVLYHRMSRSLGNEKQTLLNVQKYNRGPVAFANDLDCFAANTSLVKDENLKISSPVKIQQ